MRFWGKKTPTPHPKPETSTHKPHPKPVCVGVETMLKKLDMLVQQAEALKESIDSNTSIEEIKKTKEALQGILHKHGILRYNLKEWERRSKSIQRIDKIAEKLEKGGDNINLSIDELHAIYKQEVGGFNGSSPFNFSPYKYAETISLIQKRRIERKAKEDYARIYGCKPEQVTSEPDDVFRENSNIVVFIGAIDFTDEELPKTLKHVSGRLKSTSKNVKIPKNLEHVSGNLYLNSLTSAKGLVLPETIGGILVLSSLTSAEGLVLPEKVGGDLSLRSLESAKGLVLPETIGGNLYLMSLTSAEGLEKLNYASIIGNIWLHKTFSDKDKEEVKKIKIEQEKRGINVNFTYL